MTEKFDPSVAEKINAELFGRAASAGKGGTDHRTRRDAPTRPFQTAGEFIKEYKPMNYLLEPIIDAGGLYTLTGKTGSAKTAFLCLLALAVAFNLRGLFPKNDIEPGRVAYLTCENPRNLRMRLMTAVDKLGIKDADINGQLMIQQWFSKPAEMVEAATIAQKDGPFKLIVIDTLASFFDGDNSNDNAQIMAFLRGLRPLSELDGNPTVIVAAHPVKNATDDQLVPYGGGAILNEVDGNLTMTKLTETRSRLHWHTKIRGIDFEPLELEVSEITSEHVKDAKGALIRMPFMRVCEPGDMLRDTEEEEGDRRVRILAGIASNPGIFQSALAKMFHVNQSNISRAIKVLIAQKLIEGRPRGGYRITPKGKKELDLDTIQTDDAF